MNNLILNLIGSFSLKKKYIISSLEDWIIFLRETRFFFIDGNIHLNELVIKNLDLKIHDLQGRIYNIKKIHLIKSNIIDETNALKVDEVNYVGDIYVSPLFYGLKKTLFGSLTIRPYNNLCDSETIVFNDCVFDCDVLFFTSKVKHIEVWHSTFSERNEYSFIKLISNNSSDVLLKSLITDSIEPIFELHETVSIDHSCQSLVGVFEDTVLNLEDLKLTEAMIVYPHIEQDLQNVQNLCISTRNITSLNSINSNQLKCLSVTPLFTENILRFKNLISLRLALNFMPSVNDFHQNYIFYDGIPIRSQVFELHRYFPKLRDLSIIFKDLIQNDLVTEISIDNLHELNRLHLNCLIKDNTVASNESVRHYTCGQTSFFESIIEIPRFTKTLSIIGANCKYLYGIEPGFIKVLCLRDSQIELSHEHLQNAFNNVTCFSSHNSRCKSLYEFLLHKDIKLTEVNGKGNNFDLLELKNKHNCLITYSGKAAFTS